jgi:hypothetical protein
MGRREELSGAINHYAGDALLEVDGKFGTYTRQVMERVQAQLRTDNRVRDHHNIGQAGAAEAGRHAGFHV